MSKSDTGGWSRYIDAPDNYGFFKFNNATLNTLAEPDYEAIVEDQERWERLQARMNADFKDALDMFPFEERSEELAVADTNWIERLSVRAGNMLKSAAQYLGLSRIILPKRFYTIAVDTIETRFPGGRDSGDPGDGDIRDMISDFRILFKRNFAHYILKKRWYQLATTLVFFLSTMFIALWQDNIAIWIAQGFPTLGESSSRLVTDGLLLAIFAMIFMLVFKAYNLFSNNAYYAYRNAQTESCKTLDKQAALRTKNLSNLISTLMPRIDKDYVELMAKGRRADWSERSRRWILLVYWLGRRQETLERFTQIEMWIIRRAHYYYRIVSSVTNNIILMFSLILMMIPCGIVMILGKSSFVTLSIYDPALWGFVLMGAWLSYRMWVITGRQWNTELDLIKNNIGLNNWDRFHNVDLAQRFAEQVAADKGNLLKYEDMVAGKNR